MSQKYRFGSGSGTCDYIFMELYNKREVSMAKFLKITGVVLVSVLLFTAGFSGCAGTSSGVQGGGSSKEDTGKLEEARAAAESAERKLSELRTERRNLEEGSGTAGTEENNNEEQEQEDLPQEGDPE